MNDTSTARRVHVLAVTPFDSDVQALARIFGHTAWDLSSVPTLSRALDYLNINPAPVILTDTELPDATWKDMLAACSGMPHSPYLILAASNADDRLWAEALNLGAYDVLAKPFRSQEVFRIVGLAWRHWTEIALGRACRHVPRLGESTPRIAVQSAPGIEPDLVMVAGR